MKAGHEARLIADPKTPRRFLVTCTCGWLSVSDLSLVQAERQRKTHLATKMLEGYGA